MKKLLSSTLLALLFVCPSWADLSTGLISYWVLDESGSTTSRVDKVVASANDMTATSMGQGTGKVYPNCAQFTRASGSILNRVNNASLSTGNIDFTVAAWFNMNSNAATVQAVIGKWNGSGNQREFEITYNDDTTQRFAFQVTDDGTTTGAHYGSVVASAFGLPTASTWHFIVAWHDATANTLNIQVDNGTVNSSAWTTGVFASTAPLRIGATSDAGTIFDGLIGPVMFWKRVLISQERTDVFNFGYGLRYESLISTGIRMTPLLTLNSTTNATSYAFPSTTIHANRLAILTVQHARDAGLLGTPVPTMTGITWNPFTPNAYIQYHTTGTPTRKISGWWAYPTSDQTGVITVDFSGNTQDGAAGSLTEFEGAQSIVQSTVSSGGSGSVQVTCTLASFADAVNNVAFGAFGTSQSAGITPGAGFVEIHDVTYATPSNELQTEGRWGQDTSVDATFGAADCGCLAAELSAAAPLTGNNTWFTSQQRRRK